MSDTPEFFPPDKPPSSATSDPEEVSLSDLLGPGPDLPPLPVPTVGDVRHAMRAVAEVIAMARQAMAEDRMPSLHDLESVVRRACRVAQELPPDSRHEAVADLEAVLYDMDVLTVDLTNRFGGLALRPEAAVACAPPQVAPEQGPSGAPPHPAPALAPARLPVVEAGQHGDAPPRTTDPYRQARRPVSLTRDDV